jgi:hypothetical protein
MEKLRKEMKIRIKILTLCLLVFCATAVSAEDTQKEYMTLEEFLIAQPDDSMITPALAYRLRMLVSDLISHNVENLPHYFWPITINRVFQTDAPPTADNVDKLFKEFYFADSFKQINFVTDINSIKFSEIVDVEDAYFIDTKITTDSGGELTWMLFLEKKSLLFYWPFGGK